MADSDVSTADVGGGSTAGIVDNIKSNFMKTASARHLLSGIPGLDIGLRAGLDAIKSFEGQAGSSESSGSSAKSFTDEEREMLRALATGKKADGSELTSEERNQMYIALVSDNQSSKNKTKNAGGGTQIDVSEMTLLQKTKLSNGKFVTTDKDGERLDSFGSKPENGDTKRVCGGTITYKGKGPGFPASVDVDDKGFFDTSDYTIVTDEQRGTIVHYEGELGSFDYNTRDWELSYYTATQNGNEITVPVLHYRGDVGVDLVPWGHASIVEGSKIKIPDGLEVADYMFVGTQITSMPNIGGCKSLRSAHCMFMGCQQMQTACDAALDPSGDGTIVCPPNLEDMSWMFAGSNMTQCFSRIGENVTDARCAFQDCRKLGYVPGFSGRGNGQYDNVFQMPSMESRWLLANFCDDMFDNTPPEVVGKVEEFCKRKNGHIVSDWVDEEGVHSNIFDRTVDGSADQEKMKALEAYSARYNMLQTIDPSSPGMSGTEALTEGMASSVAHDRDGMVAQNSSTWSTLLQTDAEFVESQENQFGELADRAVAFGATYGILRGITKSNLISIGVAGAAQIVGFANKITPMLDTVATWVGKDSKVGSFLSGISDKLKSNEVSYHTKVEDLDVDKVFEKQQTASLKYVYKQMEAAFGKADPGVLIDGEGDGYGIGMEHNVTKFMEENGRSIAKDGNLIVIAMTPEAEYKDTLSNELMQVSANALADNLREDVAKSHSLTGALKSEYSSYFMTLMTHLDAYSDGAVAEISDKYRGDNAGKAAANAGLEKVMRNTAAPVYEAMAQLQKEYQGNLFTAEQVAQMDAMAPAGMPKFSEYTVGQDLTPESDPYVEKLEADRETLKQAVEAATSAEEINAAYKAYYDNAYAEIIKEAERQGVVMDTKGAESSGTNDTFSAHMENTAASMDRIAAANEIAPEDGSGTEQQETEAKGGGRFG